MRKFKLLAFLLAVPLLLTIGCKKKDKTEPTPTPPSEQYLGTWNATSNVLGIYMNGVLLESQEDSYEPGEMEVNILDNNTMIIIERDLEDPNEGYRDTISYVKIDDYSIKFILEEEDEEDEALEGTLTVNPTDKNSATINAKIEDVEIQEGFPLVDMEIKINLKR